MIFNEFLFVLSSDKQSETILCAGSAAVGSDSFIACFLRQPSIRFDTDTRNHPVLNKGVY